MSDDIDLPAPYFNSALTQQQRDSLSPDDIIALMLDGNRRFMMGTQLPRDTLAEQRCTISGQHPAAISLSCIDSRTPVEIICDLGIGDTFNARIAGYVVNDDVLGSMEYACAVAGARLVIVMGHTACGAIQGAIDDIVMGNLTGLLASIKQAVQETPYDGDRTSANPAFIDLVARTHVQRMVTVIRERSHVLRELEHERRIKIIGCMYDISSARISVL